MENKGSMKLIVSVLVVLAVGAGLYYWNAGQRVGTPESMMVDDGLMDSEVMEKEGEAMMEDGAMMTDEDDGMMQDETMMRQSGSYEAYTPEKVAAQEEGEHVVLYFRASWCPTCRALDADIKANLENIPGDLTILDVDYDNSTALKQKYGVTYQHTLVEVDANGNLVQKWSGSPTLAALVAEL